MRRPLLLLLSVAAVGAVAVYYLASTPQLSLRGFTATVWAAWGAGAGTRPGCASAPSHAWCGAAGAPPDDSSSGGGTCVRLRPAKGAGFEAPRRDDCAVPDSMEARWAVWHCAAAAAAAGGGGGGGRNDDERGLLTGHLLFCRIDTCDEQQPPSATPFLSAQPDVRARLLAMGVGPDHLYVELAGPELVRLRPAHVGGCAYRAPYAVALPGAYAVRALHLYERYRAGSDVDLAAGWPVAHQDDVLGDATLTLGEREQQQQHNATEGAWWRARQRAVLDGAGLPPCAPGESDDGRNVLSPATPAPAWTVYGTERRARRVWPFRRPLALNALAWAPYRCTLPRVSLADARACLAGKALAFYGDSQTRVFFNALLRVVAGVGAAAQKGILASQCHTTSSSGAVPNSTFCFVSNTLGDEALLFAPPRGPGVNSTSRGGGGGCGGPQAPFPFDVVLVNFGQHPASAQHGHWPYERYNASVWRLMERAAGVLADWPRLHAAACAPGGGGGGPPPARPLVVWASTQDVTPVTIPQVRFRRKHREGRTTDRLALYSELSREAVGGVNRALARRFRGAPAPPAIAYLDAFNASYSAATVTPDGAHIYWGAFQDVLIARFLALACGGGGGGGGGPSRQS